MKGEHQHPFKDRNDNILVLFIVQVYIKVFFNIYTS